MSAAMDRGPALLGASLVVTAALVWFTWLIFTALRTPSRARRLTNLSLACGAATWLMIELILLPLGNLSTGVLLAFGGVRVLVGGTGIGLAIAALAKRDEPARRWKPVAAIVLCLMNISWGLSLLVLNPLTRNTNPWVYRSPDGLFRISLPSDEWRPAPTNRATAFTSAALFMQVRVEVIPEQDEAGFHGAIERVRSAVARNSDATKDAEAVDGINGAGNRYHLSTALSTTRQGEPVVYAHSLTWLEGKRAVVATTFEGIPRTISLVANDQERKAMSQAARSILLSVE